MQVEAIDIHTHPQTEEFLAAMGARRGQMGERFGERKPISFAEMADRYREQRTMAVLLSSDDETVSGVPGVDNALIASARDQFPDTFIGFGGLDPRKGRMAVQEAERCHDLGLLGIGELNPARQGFRPNDTDLYPLWEKCQELGLVVMFHLGFLGAGAGRPGGMGYKLEYAKPIPYVDDMAADFPELRIIAAHPGWPWHLEVLAMVWHKRNVYVDLSGWAPKYWPSEVVHYANSLISEQVLFGTDWPMLSVERWTAEFDAYDWKPEVRRRILADNARALLGLDS